ncbi:MAG: hypothetical protein ACKOYM_07975 [Actinomycetes bacterium]
MVRRSIVAVCVAAGVFGIAAACTPPPATPGSTTTTSAYPGDSTTTTESTTTTVVTATTPLISNLSVSVTGPNTATATYDVDWQAGTPGTCEYKLNGDEFAVSACGTVDFTGLPSGSLNFLTIQVTNGEGESVTELTLWSQS